MRLTFTKKGLMRFSALTIICSSILLSSFIFFSNGFSTDYETENVEMNVTVTHTISITASSDALDRGILFPSSSAGANNVMAENDTTAEGNTTDYNITADVANTDDINFWHYANDMDNRGGGVTILIGNVTHEANTTAGGYNVNMTITTDGAFPLTNSFATIGNGNCSSVSAGSKCHIAYWLDVPTVGSGVFNTTYYYCGNSSTSSTPCA